MYITRNQNLINRAEDLENLYSLSKFPVFGGCTNDFSTTDLFADLNIQISKTSGMIQINPLIDPSIVYQSAHGSGEIGGWIDHHRCFANFIKEYNPTSIFEIGGASGILNAEYISKYKKIPWTILELNPTPVKGCNATWIKTLYTSDTVIEDVDMIIHSHCLEHFYNPEDFFKNTLKLNKGIKMCFSVPNLKNQLDNNCTNILNFEHTYFCDEYWIDFWLKSYGFEILNKEYYKNDHSIFYAAKKTGDFQITKYDNLYDKNTLLFKKWVTHHLDFVNLVNTFLLNSTDPIFLFGASMNSQILLNLGIDQDRIEFILDNDKLKENKRLYGTKLIVKNPKILKNYQLPIVILKAGIHTDEIKQDILKNINPNTVLIQ